MNSKFIISAIAGIAESGEPMMMSEDDNDKSLGLCICGLMVVS